MKFVVLQQWTAFAVVSLVLAGCGCGPSKSADQAGSDGTVVSNAAPSNVTRVAKLPPPGPSNGMAGQMTIITNDFPATPPATPEARQRVATLQTAYQAAGGFDDRFDVINEISEVNSVAAVEILEQLFRAETSAELREELINGLIPIGGCKNEKLRFLRLGIAANQPAAVREAAMDGLVDLEDARALPLLKELMADPDEKVRSVAKHNFELLTEMVKALGGGDAVNR